MFTHPQPYDVLIIGAGHAGVEAGLAAARFGCRTAMLTQNLDTIGQMSCNPAIGGLAKGHMVREIDALGGAMGLNTDATGIQFRMLNVKKGPSVRAPRAQCDKKAYQFRMKWMVERAENLDLHQGSVAEILVKDDQVTGVRTNLGMIFETKSIVITTGTFMRGLMHVGKQNQAGGRMGDAISTLSDSLKELGFEIERFKTGTPCRLNGRSIDFSKCDRQEGDNPAPRFSYLADTIGIEQDSASSSREISQDPSLTTRENEIFTLNRWGDPMFHVEQLPCWITWTNPETHDVIRDNLEKSPMYSGMIEGVGPRYCPSIEDKVVKFAERERHQVFLEPEGRQTTEYYVNGVSTSLPYDVQYDFLRSIAGLENCEIIRPGYAVEYDYCLPTQLFPTLETKRIAGLYLAGQINGTSGYEEAGGQGLVAGINAALKVRGEKPFTLKRSEAYIGVMIDDLVTKGCTEPYRMFTSRAEYRLVLRQDNADLRLTPMAAERGIVSQDRADRTSDKGQQLQAARKMAEKLRLGEISLAKWFKRPENEWRQLPEDVRNEVGLGEELWQILETDIKYEGYIRRQEDEIARTERMEHRPIPEGVDFTEVRGLKNEAQLKLNDVRPTTLGQAGRISGITPADISLLSVYLQRSEIERD